MWWMHTVCRLNLSKKEVIHNVLNRSQAAPPTRRRLTHNSKKESFMKTFFEKLTKEAACIFEDEIEIPIKIVEALQ